MSLILRSNKDRNVYEAGKMHEEKGGKENRKYVVSRKIH